MDSLEYSTRVLDQVTSRLTRSRSTAIVEFDYFDIEASYHLEGRYWPETETSPAEYPQIIVDESKILCGDFITIAPFSLLSQSVQDEVLEAIREENLP